MTLPFRPAQPMPVALWAHRHGVGRDAETVIVRCWAPDDVPRCRLCPAHLCNVVANTCMVIAARDVEPKGLALYSFVADA